MKILTLDELKHFLNTIDYPGDTEVVVATETKQQGDIEYSHTTQAIDVSGHVEHGKHTIVIDLLETYHNPHSKTVGEALKIAEKILKSNEDRGE